MLALYILFFFFNEVSKSSKLAFPICYVGENLISILCYILNDYSPLVISSPPKKKKFNKNILNYEIIENNNIELY